MASVKDVLSNIQSSASRKDEGDIMANPDYLRKSQALITDALQKGFDVLQLESGDVVVTGTKTIVTQYAWDGKKGKMTKVVKRGKRKASDEDFD